jgi:GTP-binding protein
MTPVIAIVGRPNVGKSTLFNRLTGSRQALVHDRPGVTRDRHYGSAQYLDREVILIDTGGFEPDLNDLAEGALFRQVRRQAEAAIEEADLVLFVVDREAGLTAADHMTAEILRKALGSRLEPGRLLLVVNKCDGPKHDDDSAEFYSMGLGDQVCISAEHGRNIYDLWEAILERVQAPEVISDDDDEDDRRSRPKNDPAEEAAALDMDLPLEQVDADDGKSEIRIAVIGRPNIGKSTLVNLLIGEERHVVHDMPGTTMDAVDSVFVYNGRPMRLVDTAGIRRRARIDDRLETYATMRAIKAIERCHVTLLVIDGVEGVTAQDARLAALIADRGRACLVIVNRWDLIKTVPDRNHAVVEDELRQSLPHLDWAPALYTSALTAKGCHRILPLVEEVFRSFDQRISTSRLNDWLRIAVAANQPPQKHHHPVRLNYATQARVRPPTFILFSNSPEAIRPPYRRYLENQLREAHGFVGTPIRLKIRQKRRPGESKADD